MNDEPKTASGEEEGALQFDRADYAGEPAETMTCSACETPLHHHYFDANGQPLCERCRYEVEEAFKKRPGAAGFLKALAAGLGAAAVGCGIYYAILAGTGYEFSLIAILVGWMVGKAVSWGAQGKGGWAYQSLAMFLTYMAIVSTYIPMIFQEFNKQAAETQAAVAPQAASSQPGASQPAATSLQETSEAGIGLGGFLLGILAIFGFAAALPFLAGFENILGIVIIAIGVYEAWKLNKRTVLEISGPYEIGRRADPPAPAPESA